MIGQNIKKCRESLRMTQAELAKKVKMKQPHISKIEGGHVPSVKTLQKICKALGVSICDVLT